MIGAGGAHRRAPGPEIHGLIGHAARRRSYRVGRSRSRRLVVPALIALLALGCVPTNGGQSRASRLSSEAQTLEWPNGTAPTGVALARFADRIGASGQPLENRVGWANLCAWYSIWRSQMTQDGTADPGLVSDLTVQLPLIGFLLTNGGPDIFGNLGRSAARGDVGPVDHFLATSRCDQLQSE